MLFLRCLDFPLPPRTSGGKEKNASESFEKHIGCDGFHLFLSVCVITNNDDDLLLKIQFKFLNSGSNPSIDGLKIYPSNYEYFSFDALKTTNTHLNTGLHMVAVLVDDLGLFAHH